MAGGFVHISAAAEALGRLKEVDGLTSPDKRVLRQLQPFVEVGSVGPDYPYLGGQSKWADLMHYEMTGETIRNGVRVLRRFESGSHSHRAMAWLLGYCAHVATDLTIHPVVERCVGTYADNKKKHRVCEMNQDAFIWKGRNLGDIGLADYFNLNIRHCSDEDGDLHSAVVELWLMMLEFSYPESYATERPEIQRWNKGFRVIVDSIDDLGSLFAFSRHLLAGQGVAYPSPDAIDMTYVENLQTPEGLQHYSQVFDRAVGSVISLWSVVGRALHATNEATAEAILQEVPDGNLDTGKSLAGSHYIFWAEV